VGAFATARQAKKGKERGEAREGPSLKPEFSKNSPVLALRLSFCARSSLFASKKKDVGSC